MEIIIYSQHGKEKLTVSPSDTDTHTKEVMGDNVVTLSFTLSEFVLLRVNDYIEIEEERYKLLEEYRPEQLSTIEYVYNCNFYGIESALKKAKVLKLVDNENELSFAFDATAAEHLQLICDNVNRINGGTHWTTGEIVASGNVNIEYDNLFCHEALTKIAEAFETEWWIEGTTINLSRCEHGNAVPLGYNKGLLNLSRQPNNTVPVFTRLYPLGTTRNIDAKEYGHKRLQLPGGVKYVERNTYLGIIEQAEEEAFAGIYPRREGTISSTAMRLTTGDDGKPYEIHMFGDDALTFDPNDYLMAGLVMRVVFQSGELNGRDFEVNYNSKTRFFEIITQFPYDNQQLPGGKLIPHIGDKYILFNLKMPKEYYTLAEKEFAEAVDKYLDKISIDTSIYKAATDYIYMEDNDIKLTVGQRVTLESNVHFPGGTQVSRITKISRKLCRLTDAEIECSYAVDYGKLNKMESDINDIRAAYTQHLNHSILQVLKSWDSADPSEYNVFSAVRSIKMLAKLEREIATKYLRKDILDTAEELITFRNGISSDGFTSGFPGGTGWALLWKELLNAAGETERKALLELDEVTVRGAIRMYEMIVAQLSGENGTRITTDMMRVSSIDAAEKKIYLDTENGLLYNPFKPGDVLMVQQWNDGETKKYGLIVTEAGLGTGGEEREDWITYTSFDGDINSVAPRDVLTRVDSILDDDRKGIIKHTSIEEGAPYMDVLHGMITDPDNSIRVRLGRLTGIITHWWGRLNGYGLYSDNAYLKGDFMLRTGEDVRTKFEVVEGLLTSTMQGMMYDLTEEDNLLANATFTRNMDKWEKESDISIYDAGGLVCLSANLLSEKTKVADIVTRDGRLMLRIKNSFVRQRNEHIRKPEKNSTLYLSFRYYCQEAGTLRIGFENTDKTQKTGPLTVEAIPIAAGTDFVTYEKSGVWSGFGDFLIDFDGDIFIEQLYLKNHPLEDYKRTVETLFQQTAESISAVATKVDELNDTISSAGWITTSEGNLIWAAKDGIISAINQSAEEIKIQASKISLEGSITANGNVFINPDGTIIATGGRFNGYLSMPFKRREDSDVRSSSGGANHYALNNDLNIICREKEVIILPTTEKYNGAIVSIFNAVLPPYTRTSLGWTTTIRTQNLRGFIEVKSVLDVGVDYVERTEITIIGCLVQFLCVPTTVNGTKVMRWVVMQPIK